MPLFILFVYAILSVYTLLFVLLPCFVCFNAMRVKQIRQRIKKDLVLWVMMSLLLGFGIFYILMLFWPSFPQHLILLTLLIGIITCFSLALVSRIHSKIAPPFLSLSQETGSSSVTPLIRSRRRKTDA